MIRHTSEPGCGCEGTIRTPLSDASRSDCRCHGTIQTNLSHASGPSCGCHETIHTSLSHACIRPQLWVPRNYSHESLTCMHQAPVVGATKLFTRVSHMHASGPSCGCHETIHTSLAHASGPSCGCHRPTYRDTSDALELACWCSATTHIFYISYIVRLKSFPTDFTIKQRKALLPLYFVDM